jgi:exopolyphosphatase / guanosine-5'-triphosphate,3'-diphosphate pyrophosphatase
MRCAIIDLGSNTFHLLIAEIIDNKITTLFRERVFTRLSDGGIERLNDVSIDKGLSTLLSFRSSIDQYDVDKIKIIGTAALRTASNAETFILPAEKIMGHPIMIIDGDHEAELIYKGVKLLSPMIERSLIMDIGGGSTEFIIVEGGQKIWAQSYKLGVGVLHALFHKSEPITKQEVSAAKDHIIASIAPLLLHIKSNPIITLIGASGSFEIFESMTGKTTFEREVNQIDINDARAIIEKITTANLEQRQSMEGLPPDRTKLIVVGMILVDVILDEVKPQILFVTPYALKEGLLSEMM